MRAHFFAYGCSPLIVVGIVLCVFAGRLDAQSKPVPKKAPLKPPHVMAQELIGILQNKKTAWQLYGRYAKLFQGYAVTVSRSRVADKTEKKRRDALVKHYEGMSSLISQMASHAKTRDEIRLGISSVPFGDRQKTFTAAGAELDALLDQFRKMTLQITPKPMPDSARPKQQPSPARAD